MPCQLQDWEIKAEEESRNNKNFGLALTDAAVATEVACQACRRLEHLGAMGKASALVKKWWQEHKRQDEERKRNETAYKTQEENEEKKILRRLMQKYPNEIK